MTFITGGTDLYEMEMYGYSSVNGSNLALISIIYIYIKGFSIILSLLSQASKNVLLQDWSCIIHI